MQQLLQFLLQLHEVTGGDQAILGLVQAVSGKLHQLVLNKSQHTVSQGQSGVRGTLRYDVEQLTLHLGRRLGNKDGYSYRAGDTSKNVPKDASCSGERGHILTGSITKNSVCKKAFIDHSGKVWKKKNIGGGKEHFAYLWKPFFVHVVHHHNFIVKWSTAPSRAEQQRNRSETLNIY